MRISLFIAILVVCSLGPDDVVRGQQISFNRDIRPILSNRCFHCHGPDQNTVAAGLNLESREIATHEVESGSIPIVPGRPDESELISRVADPDDEMRMPPPDSGPRLTEKEIETFRQWISQGAEYEKHWSYVRPTRPAVPVVDALHSDWPLNPVDHFVLAKMLEHGLQPSIEADRAALARRVFLDLTGLPPTMEEVEALLSDPDPKAYENLVDRLLQRPTYGEHWARKWLDLARYADSSGYADDPPRTIWAYRDWVIRALNDNVPFDQFTIDQLAGDLLPNPTEDQLIATAFHRNTQTNNEGGTNNEEFRNVAVVDRVNTTLAVWMGTTMACAQCHHHKYDPISQEDYFRVFAILNNSQDADLSDDSPKLPLFSDEQKLERSQLANQIAALQQLIDTPTEELATAQQHWERNLQTPAAWQVVVPASVVRANGEALRPQADQNFLVTTATDTDTYTVDIPLIGESSDAPNTQISAIRLKTFPHPSLPAQGSGHGGGNFVITQVRAQLVPDNPQIPLARFVRISLPGKQKILSLAEVQVFAGGTNHALQGTATQSSVDFEGHPELANDDNTQGIFTNRSVTHTANSDDPWWELDLQSEQPIERLVVWNRTDDGVQERLKDFEVTLYDKDRNLIWQQNVGNVPSPAIELTPSQIRPLVFADAIADYHQDQFPAESVVDGKADSATGWAIGGAVQQPHQLTLILAQPLTIRAPARLRIAIEQDSIHSNHLLGNFRLETTSDETTIDRARVPEPLLEIIDRPLDQRDAESQAQLAGYFRQQVAPELRQQRMDLAAAKVRLAAIQPATSVLVMRELQENRRVTNLQYRGSYQDLGPAIEPGIPAALSESSLDKPADRLALARWIVDDANPLTARVLANRYWETLFGRGLVVSSEDFGSQGDLPTHPELLDWLAEDVKSHGWDVKYLVKLIVTSATYRQSAKVSVEAAAADSENRWLSRGPRVRLSAETIRDQALFVSDLLSSKMFGPPVRPPQPSFGLTAAFGGSTDWNTSEGDDRYRRAIYTNWRRSNPYPSMMTFDAPNRETCTIRRNNTNTPLQSLVTLNDPVYVEASQGLARWSLQSSDSLGEQISSAFRRCLLRQPKQQELQSLVNLYHDSQKQLAGQSELALKLSTEPMGPLPTNLNPIDTAAMTVVSNVILNLDEMFLKR